MRARAAIRPEPTPVKSSGQAEEPATLGHPAPVWHMRHILVPVDFSDCSLQALEYALRFAQQFGSRLTLLHVVEPALHPDSYLLAPAFDGANQNLLQAARERVESICEKHVGNRMHAEILVRMGRAYSEIPDTAKALGADLVILGTHGYSGMKHVLLGSTAERVVRNAPCPVLTVRAAAS